MINSRYPLASMGSFLRLRKVFFVIDDVEEYQLVTVQLHARGIKERSRLVGADIKTKRQQRIKAGDLLVAEIDAKVGGYGIVPDTYAGAIVSSHYFLYEIDRDIVEPQFLEYYLKSGYPEDDVRQFVKGSVNYAAIRSQHFLQLNIPLPPLDEQRRIVQRIQMIADRAHQAHTLTEQIESECDDLCRSILFDKTADKPAPTPMRELVRLRKTDVAVVDEEIYQFAGTYSFGRGLLKGESRLGSEFSYSRLTRLQVGNLVYPKLMAWEGAFAVVPDEFDGFVVSPEFPVFEINVERVLPEVIDVYFRTPAVWPEIHAISAGTNKRRRRLHPTSFLEYEFPLPSMAVQQKLQQIKPKVDALKAEQTRIAKELEALLPSVLDKAFKGEL
jgi:type I restriction enzyme S subunit